MKFMVPKFLATTPVSITLYGGTDENGENIIIGELSTKCRMQVDNGTTYLPDGKKANLSAKLFIFDMLEIFPEKISGICSIEGIKYDIAKGSKKRNPDGTINHVVLELM